MNISYSLLPNYEYQRVIGHGTFGYVFEAYDRTNKRRVAIKRVQKISKQLSREYEVLLLLRGEPNIIQIEDIFLSQTDEGLNVQNIVFEYKEYSLESIISKGFYHKQYLDPQRIKTLMRQLFIGMISLSKKKVVHRDLKPENILVDSADNVAICDFGSAKVIDEYGCNTPYVVSQYYRAPELILSHTNYGPEIDIWAIGCIFSEMMDLKVLFEGKNEGDQLYSIFSILGSLRDIEMIYLFQYMDYNKEIQKRFTGYEPREMVFWYEKFKHIPEKERAIDLLLRMLQINPNRRISAIDALNHPYFN